MVLGIYWATLKCIAYGAEDTKIPVTSVSLLHVCSYSPDSVHVRLKHQRCKVPRHCKQSIITSSRLAYQAGHRLVVEFPVVVLTKQCDSGAGQGFGFT